MNKSIHNHQYRLMISLLREERLSRNITQKQLATKLNVNQAIISKIETCERRIDFIELRQLCLALDLSPIDFINKFEKTLII